MKKKYYETTRSQILLSTIVIFLLAISLVIQNPVVIAFLCLTSMNTLMLHFILFKSTANSNKLAIFDFVIQLSFFLITFFNFLYLTS